MELLQPTLEEAVVVVLLMTPTLVVVTVDLLAVVLVEIFNRMDLMRMQTLVVAVVVLVVDRLTINMVATVDQVLLSLHIKVHKEVKVVL